MSDDEPESGDGGRDVTRRQVDPDPSTAEYDLLEIIAERDGREIEELPSLYNEVEHVVETLFKTPPSQRAQMQVSFSYSGYRVTIDRSGAVEVMPEPATA